MKFKAAKPRSRSNDVVSRRAAEDRLASQANPRCPPMRVTRRRLLTERQRAWRLTLRLLASLPRLPRGRELELDPPLAGPKPTSLAALWPHRPANLYPYDYYRDCPDTGRSHARAASLVAGAQGGAQLSIVRRRRRNERRDRAPDTNRDALLKFVESQTEIAPNEWRLSPPGCAVVATHLARLRRRTLAPARRNHVDARAPLRLLKLRVGGGRR